MTPPLRRLARALSAHHLDQEARHVAVFLSFGIALALAAGLGVAWAAGFGNVAHRLRHVDVFWFPLALGSAVAAHLGYVLAYREIVHVNEGPRLDLPRALALVSTGFGIFVPRGGFALDLEALRDLGISQREARVRVLGLGALEYVVLATGACVCSFVLLVRHSHVHHAVTLSWAIGVPAGAVLALLALRYRRRLCHNRLGGVLRPGLDALEVVGKILGSPRRHGFAALFGMSAYWVGEVYVLWACVAAFAHRPPPVPSLVVAYATGYALTRRTLPFAGAGAVEALLPFALSWVGFALAAALLAVFAYRVFNLWLPVGPGLVGLLVLRRRSSSRGRRSPSSRS
jgi:uncharacterized membrane protein YbhN (UPF0104 family)